MTEIPEPINRLVAELKTRGFTVTAERNWRHAPAARRFLDLVADGLFVRLSQDGDWLVSVSADGAESQDLLSASAWAVWLGMPLPRPPSEEDQARFLLDNLEFLQREVKDYDRAAMSSKLKDHANDKGYF